MGTEATGYDVPVGTYEDAKAMVGTTTPVRFGEIAVSVPMIRHYAAMVRDANAAYWDDDFAERHWGVVAPPGMLMTWLIPLEWRPGGGRPVPLLTDRVQFGRPIGSFQAVQHHVADLSSHIDAAGLAAWQAVWRCSLGSDAPADAGSLEAAVAIAKVAAGDAYVETTLMAHQLHGGIGFMDDHDLHLWSDRARAAALAFGTREDHLRALGTLVARAR
jgi:hypothetical protein